MTEHYILYKSEELNERINDAFMKLDTQRNRINGLTKENSELKQKITKLNGEVHNLRIFLGIFSMIAVGIWTVQWVLY